MKLVIQIPCYNEEHTLPIVLKELPRQIEGISKVEILVINDGSTDKTHEVAVREGADHVLDFPYNCGLAKAFSKGLEKAVGLGADIIVNTDGDNQYKGADIPALIRPILEKRAEIVIGCRHITKIRHFTLTKKILQKAGSAVVRKFSNTSIPDVTSGFRAYTRDAALRLNVFSAYTYTIETIIQVGRKEIPMSYISVTVNTKLRESRLISNVLSYVMRSAATILRIYLMYEPLKSFLKISLFPLSLSVILVVRFLMSHFTKQHGGHVQSLIIAAVGILIGLGVLMMGFLGDIIAANRKLEEEILYHIKKNHLTNLTKNKLDN